MAAPQQQSAMYLGSGSETLEGIKITKRLVKIQIAAPPVPRVSDLVGLEEELRICISNQFPSDGILLLQQHLKTREGDGC